MPPPNSHHPLSVIRGMSRGELAAFVEETKLEEEEALAVLDNRHATAEICQAIAQNSKLTSFYSVRARLVGHRATPQAFAMKFVPHLYWTDLLRISVDVRVPAPIRRAADNQLLARLPKLTIGERTTTARSCSREIVKVLTNDPDPKVFAALLDNPRLVEEDLVALIGSERARVHQLSMIATSRKWSSRRAIRLALVTNPETPRAVAASQLRFLSAEDLRSIHARPETSTYLRRCIERFWE